MTQTIQKIYVGSFAEYFTVRERGSDKSLNFKVFRLTLDLEDLQRIGKDIGYKSAKVAGKLAHYMAVIDGKKHSKVTGPERAELLKLYNCAIPSRK